MATSLSKLIKKRKQLEQQIFDEVSKESKRFGELFLMNFGDVIPGTDMEDIQFMKRLRDLYDEAEAKKRSKAEKKAEEKVGKKAVTQLPPNQLNSISGSDSNAAVVQQTTQMDAAGGAQHITAYNGTDSQG